MLKTIIDDKAWLITQPDHAQVAGYLASHWGNDEFARPGYFANASDPERLRAETVMAVAQHDNGWWEWEATKDLSKEDGFPPGLVEVLKNQQEGMDRWRLGLRRFTAAPYANLLISYHAYWLYAARVLEHPDPAFMHPLFWKGIPERLYSGKQEKELEFMGEIEELQRNWIEEHQKDSARSGWVQSENLNPHARLLQLLDGVSLSLCSALISARSGASKGLGEDEFDLLDVPRARWEDRVKIEVRPVGRRRIVMRPYPFDEDPLTVQVVARVFELGAEPAGGFQTWWNGKPIEVLEFRYGSCEERLDG